MHLYINKKNHFGHSFAFDAPMVWNDIPDEVRSASTLACFRKRLKIVNIYKYILYPASLFYQTWQLL